MQKKSFKAKSREGKWKGNKWILFINMYFNIYDIIIRYIGQNYVEHFLSSQMVYVFMMYDFIHLLLYLLIVYTYTSTRWQNVCKYTISEHKNFHHQFRSLPISSNILNIIIYVHMPIYNIHFSFLLFIFCY